jgi:hypothetical protein
VVVTVERGRDGRMPRRSASSSPARDRGQVLQCNKPGTPVLREARAKASAEDMSRSGRSSEIALA